LTKKKDIKNFLIPTRRFGRTEIQMPILSLGGMRFQQSWKDLEPKEICKKEQDVLKKTISQASKRGLHHIETARHYGTSELQIGWTLSEIDDPKRILQTKIPPNKDPLIFEQELELSLNRLGTKKIDLLAIHGINLPEHLDMTMRPNGCLDVVRRWQKNGLIDHIGFSTHAKVDLIIKAIETGVFDYVNLHWYFIKQENQQALAAAKANDMGIFIISPTDKGGHLHTPSSKLLELCSPLHPIEFNDLFCLSDKRVHTLSVGASRPEDLDIHVNAISKMDNMQSLISTIEKRLKDASCKSLGTSWLTTWNVGLPHWNETPGHINLFVLLWLHNLLEAWDMESFAKDRYGLLGRGGHWFPGSNADCLDCEVSEDDLKKVLINSPWRSEIPSVLRKLKYRLGGERRDRLWGV
tara:strand:+ start:994 stop:2220 length:1227 start_codon:yes stop_codon:yes gene_type:complete